jgi:hypothetical protein
MGECPTFRSATGPIVEDVMSTPLLCGLCERPFERSGLTKHHCLPKSRGGTQEDVELLCGQCHSTVHANFTNPTLERVYPTLLLLRDAPELGPYLRWVRKQPPTRRKKNRPRRSKM